MIRSYLFACLAVLAWPVLATPSWVPPGTVAIPAGVFVLGTNQPRQGPPTRKTMPAFAITATEITVGDFRAFVQATGYTPPTGCFDWRNGEFDDDAGGRWDDPVSAPSDKHPVVCVRWADAVAHADWLSKTTGATWRLPTEAQWEYAARGGKPASPPLTPKTACAAANLHDAASAAAGGPKLSPLPCNDGHAKTAPVGTRAANALRLFDTLGNVAEWTASCWRDAHDAAEEDCSRHVVRGGAWKDDLIQATPTSRVGLPEVFRSRYFGFRLVRERR